MFERIAYVSRAASHVGVREAYDIIRTAHNRNAAHGLTGGLLFLDGCFAQVLEGDAFRVQERWRAIAADARHHSVELRLRATVEVPLFAGHWMALRLPDEVPAELRAAHGYRPGFPAPPFDGEALVAFIHACCHGAVPALPVAG